MKKTRRRSLVLYILSIGFFVGISLFVFRLVSNAETWVMKPINGHLSGDELNQSGTIYDTNGVVLAQSKDQKRVYNDDINVRKAMLHVVGDDSPNIATSIQNVYKSELFGYNFVLGLSAPKKLRTSKDITLTLDSNLCKFAYQKLGDNKGAIAVYNYKTGEILCMASTPTYDPENIPDIDSDTTGKYDGVYLNRVLSGALTPGSTFKIITSIAAIDNIPDIYDETFTCKQTKTVNNEKISCIGYHGNIGIKNAFVQSCNITFADIAMDLGADKMTSAANSLGFNHSFYIDGIPLERSVYNVEGATEASLGWSGVGQYNDLVNPAHMMMILGAIADGGTPTNPYMVKYMTSNLGIKSHVGSAVKGTRMMSENTAKEVSELMRYAVKNNYGDSMFGNLEVCAKTGTAEVSSDKSKEPHSWMVGFSKDSDCPLAFVVVVENGGSGIKTAGSIAASVMDKAQSTLRS